MGLLRVVSRMFGRNDDISKLQEQASELSKARGDLRKSVSGLGQDVWDMVETGDPLQALAHGARSAQFHKRIEETRDGDD